MGENPELIFAIGITLNGLAHENYSHSPIENLFLKIGSDYHGQDLPVGYTVKELKISVFKIEYNLLKWIRKTRKKKLEIWKDLILNSEEYDYLSEEEKIEALKKPAEALGGKYVLEIEKVFKFFKKGKFIGYFLYITDHIQAAIYQDGAWYDMYLDVDQNIISLMRESA